MDIVRTFFAEEMMQVIQQIPISRRGGKDFISWPHENFGLYTIRSAYNLATTTSFYTSNGTAGRGSSSDEAAQSKEWKSIWSIQCPGEDENCSMENGA
jgi:hypothetical protein